MKDITKKSRRRRIFAPHTLVNSQGNGIKVRYAAPTNPNDLKRWGKELTIVGPSFSIRLDGRAIRSIKKVLEKAGELS